MTGLLIKDWYTLIKQAAIFFVIILVFSVSGEALSAFAIVYAAMLPISALAYDERAKWDALAAMMPYSAREMVLSKYVLGYMAMGAAAVLSTVAQVVIARVKSVSIEPGMLPGVLATACVASIMLALALPFLFKLGVERGRIAFFLIIAAMTVVGAGGGEWIKRALDASAPSMGVVLALVALATIALNVASVLVSIAFYKRKAG